MWTVPEVSVIIPCYNAALWIRETLGSVYRGQPDDVEVIVVDDGSTDDTAAIVEHEFPQSRLIRTPNRGASQARNKGTEAATGEYLQYLDADDLLAPGKIAVQLRALDQNGADVAYGDWQRLVQCGDAFQPGEKVQRQMHRLPELELFLDFWSPPAAYLFRREIVDRVGGWNERLPVIQDARFALDCALCGGEFVYCPGISAYYRQHSGGSLSRRDRIAFVRDIYMNAREVEAWWERHGGLTGDRKESVITVLSSVARASYERDPSTFEAALAHLEGLRPGFVPSRPPQLAVASRLIGYRRAEALASVYRRVKDTLHCNGSS
jgi:glycosyltransferase involved in cell wall biosynthesis